MKKLGSILANKRKEKKMSQPALANALEFYNIHVKTPAVCSWEKNVNTPSASQFLAMCEILGIYDIYESFIGEDDNCLLHDLNEAGIAKVIEYADLLRASGKFEKKAAQIIPFAPRRMKISLLASSAGTGDFMDDENFEERDIYDPVPDNADFGVPLNGDSMEPQFKDNQIVWIEKTEEVRPGEIGLFFLDGKTYFKKLLISSEGTFLVSLNPKYKPIPVSEYANLKVFGRLATI